MVGATFVTSDVGKPSLHAYVAWYTIQYNTPQGSIEGHGGYSAITNMSISRRRATATLMKAHQGPGVKGNASESAETTLSHVYLTHSLPIDDCNPGH